MNNPASPYHARVERVRDALQRHSVAAVLIPSSDPHLSEYLPERWQGRQWISGFSGSMATLIISLDRAALFADSRYWVQAAAELAGSGIELVKVSGASLEPIQWLCKNVAAGLTVGVDGNVLSLSAASALQTALDSAGIDLKTDFDVFDEVWPARPPLPAAPVYEHLPPHAVTVRAAKLAKVRAEMSKAGATHHFISTLDDIAWLLNLRGADVHFNPVFLAHLLLGERHGMLFVADGKVDDALADRLAADGIHLAPYADAARALAELPVDSVLLIDPKRITLGLRENATVAVVEAINPTTLMKSRKSVEEAGHIRAAMAEDGAAMCEFYAWFEAAITDKHRSEVITELTIDERISAARARRPGFVGLSFNTIAAFNANGAMPHYRATAEAHAVIAGDGLLLIDSGAQYQGGTTDITRVWPIGVVTAAQRRDYTLVLKGMMALSRTRFPRGTLSPMLDAIARAPLWEHGLDYGHGTGHGVGYFLNVHEGPQTISKAIAEPNMAMVPGMVTSIEPGVYRPGHWGVRIENLVLTVTASPLTSLEFGEFLEFETLTLCPIDTRCIERELLRPDEVDWLNAYHATVRARLKPLVQGAALAWLLVRTAPI